MEQKGKDTIPDCVVGHIYKATCLSTNKSYVGKTKSHRWNHNKWRPFGYERRWKGHLTEAINNVKKNQCTYLNNAIRKYGKDDWKVELLMSCDLNKCNEYESQFITENNTLYPNGYNLTGGGDGGSNISKEQKKRISETVTKVWQKEGMREMYSNKQVKKNDVAKKERVLNKQNLIHKITIHKSHYKNIYDVILIKCYDKNAKPIKLNKFNHIVQYGGRCFSIEDSLKRVIDLIQSFTKEIEVYIIEELSEIYDTLLQDTSIAGSS